MIAQRPTLDQGRRVLRHGAAGPAHGTEPSARPPKSAEDMRPKRVRKVLRWVAAVMLILAMSWLAREVILGTVRTIVATLALFGLGIGIVLLLVGGIVAAHWLWRSGRRVVGGIFGVAAVLLWFPAVALVGAAGFSSYAFDADITAVMAETPPSKRRVFYARDYGKEVPVAAEAWSVGPKELRASRVDDAIIAIEDREFDARLTGPLDLLGKTRGLLAYTFEGKKQAGSSIDEQLAKFVRRRRAFGVGDYIVQDLIAMRVVWLVGDRDQVLVRYTNLWEVSPNRRGMAALAFDLFGIVDLTMLSAGQAAQLAGMLRSPSEFDPRSKPEAAKKRRDVVLEAMVEVGRLSPSEAAEAKREPLASSEMRDRIGLRAAAAAAKLIEE